ncbi:MAG: hypothetical protein C1943_09450, partial [Halochromatium sp.]|nr:hypothetical protein [Halochromatium sp.]
GPDEAMKLPEGAQAQDHFAFRVTDAHGNSTDSTVTIDITGENNAPIITANWGMGFVDKDVFLTNTDARLQVGVGSERFSGLVIEDTFQAMAGHTSTKTTASSQEIHDGFADQRQSAGQQHIRVQGTGSGATQGNAADEHPDHVTWSLEGSTQGTYGSLALDSTTGEWVYTLDTSRAATQALAAAEVQPGAFIPTDASGSLPSDTFTIKVTDDHGLTDTQVIKIAVVGTNDDPVLSVTQTTPTTGTLTETDVDTGDTHSFSVASGTGQFGTLTVDPDTGAYTYTPSGSVQGMAQDPNTGTYSGTDTFEVTVTDNHGGTDTKYITFSPTGTVTAPATNGGQPTVSTTVPVQPSVTDTQPSASTSHPNPAAGNWATIDLAATSDTGSSDTDDLTSDTTLTITGTTVIPFSKVEILEGSKVVATTYSDANGDYSVDTPALADGAHSLIAQATGPAETSPLAGDTLDLNIDTAAPAPTITLDPITGDDILNAAEVGGTVTLTGTVSGEFTDGDRVRLVVGGHAHYADVQADGSFSLDVPGSEFDKSYSGAAPQVAVMFATKDLAGNIGVAPAADRPYTVDSTLPVPTLSIDDVTADDVLNAAEAGQAIAITGTVGGDFSDGDTVTLTVNGTDFTGTVDAQGAFSIDVPGADLKADPDTQIDGSVSATDAAGNTATATATHGYSVDAGASVTDDSQSVIEDTQPSVTDNVLTNDDTGLTITNPGDQQGSYGTLKLAADGSYTYSLDQRADGLNEGEAQHETFTYEVTDAAGNSEQATLTIGITGTNDAPTVSGTSVVTGAVTDTDQTSGMVRAMGTLTATDVDAGDAVSWAVIDGGPHAAGQPGSPASGYTSVDTEYGTLLLNDTTGKWIYRLNTTSRTTNALLDGEHQTDTITVRVTDSHGASVDQTLTIDITGTNDAPIIRGTTGTGVATGGTSQSGIASGIAPADVAAGQVTEDSAQTTATGVFPVFDEQGDVETWSVDGNPQGTYGSLSIDPQSGQWTYTLDNSLAATDALQPGQKEIETFTLKVTDDHGASSTREIKIEVFGTNDDPVLGVTQTTPTTGTLTETDVDTGDTHTFSVASGAGQFGTLTVDPDTGAYTYTPSGSVQGMAQDPNTGTYSGIDTFEVTVTDNHGGTDTKYITFSPTGTVSAPAQPGGQPTVTTSVAANPAVTDTPPAAGGTAAPDAPDTTLVEDISITLSPDGLSADDEAAAAGLAVATGADLQGETPDSLDATVDRAQPAADANDSSVAIDALDPAAVAQAADADDSIALTGTVTGAFSDGDQVMLSVNGVDYQGAVDGQGHFSIDVLGADLKADPDATLEGLLVTTDADGNQQTFDFTQSLGDLSSSTPTADGVTVDAATADAAAADADAADTASVASSEPEPIADTGGADHLSPYLDMVGAADGGNGGQAGLSASASSPYLDSVGVTPETAQNGASTDTTADDDAAAVADADPFEAAPDTADADPMDAIQGAPDDITLVEPPPVAEVDIDQQHHG